MKTVDVYSQYFRAKGEFHSVARNGARVFLTATSDQGMIKYEAAVTFFPHRDEEDYAVSYDAFFSKTLYEGKGRRSKKKEEAYLKAFRAEIDALAQAENAEVLWDEPLRDGVYA